MTGIKIEDVAFVGFRAPDLDIMRNFMEDFGATVAWRDPRRLFVRGCGNAPFVHMTELGDPGFSMIGLRASSLNDLNTLAAEEGVEPARHDAPGGGQFIDLTDPDGVKIRVVAGQVPAVENKGGPPAIWNTATNKPRTSAVKRVEQGPAKVVRLGHCVFGVSNFGTSEDWYKSRFGLITSDEIELAPGIVGGAFLRCDRGATPTDHHTLALLELPSGPGFNHAAFEVRDVEDLLAGHARLKAQNHQPAWGIGRHYLGSQVFDYWRDPWGSILEHWTDGDMFTADDKPQSATFEYLVGVQWGPPMPADFERHHA